MSRGYSVIMVVIDIPNKYSHFIPLRHPYTAMTIAHKFMENIFKLHGIPQSIVSDRDAVFTSLFWKEIFRLSGTKLLMSSAYHPQTDGQTEAMNKWLECYLRCFTRDRPKDWTRWLAVAEWSYNTSVHSSTGLSPFEVVYGKAPPRLQPYEPGSTAVQAVEDKMKSRDFILKLVQENLQEAQTRMKHFADKNRTDREYEVGDWVYLRLRPYRQMSVAVRRNLKLSARYFGPFQITQKVGKVAYKLGLPPSSKIYPIFHVSCLKKKIGVRFQPNPSLPNSMADGMLAPKLHRILARRMKKKGNRARAEILAQWEGSNEEDASWVDVDELRRQCPELVGEFF